MLLHLAGSRKWNPFTWYNEMLEKYPITTKCITSGGIETGLILWHLNLVVYRNIYNDPMLILVDKCIFWIHASGFVLFNFYLFSFSTVLFAMGDFIAQKTAASKNSSLDDKVWLYVITFSLLIILEESVVFFFHKKIMRGVYVEVWDIYALCKY